MGRAILGLLGIFALMIGVSSVCMASETQLVFTPEYLNSVSMNPAFQVVADYHSKKISKKVFLKRLEKNKSNLTNDQFPPIVWACVVTQKPRQPCKFDLRVLEALLKSEIDPNQKIIQTRLISGETHFTTALNEMVHSENLEGVQLLLNHGANPNQRDSSEIAPLSIALQAQNEAMVKLLINQGAKINETEFDFANYQYPAFFHLIGKSSQDEKILTMAVHYGADLSWTHPQKGDGLLKFSIETLNPKLAQIALKHGARKDISVQIISHQLSKKPSGEVISSKFIPKKVSLPAFYHYQKSKWPNEFKENKENQKKIKQLENLLEL